MRPSLPSDQGTFDLTLVPQRKHTGEHNQRPACGSPLTSNSRCPAFSLGTSGNCSSCSAQGSQLAVLWPNRPGLGFTATNSSCPRAGALHSSSGEPGDTVSSFLMAKGKSEGHGGFFLQGHACWNYNETLSSSCSPETHRVTWGLASTVPESMSGTCWRW